MIEQAVKNWEERKDRIRETFAQKHPEDYKDIVRTVIEVISNDDYEEFCPDPERIHVIDDGHYQGTLLFVIPEKGYQPSTYYSVMMGYGSCSACDTFQSIKYDYSSYDDEDNEIPSEKQISGYMSLALHVVQQIKLIGDRYAD